MEPPAQAVQSLKKVAALLLFILAVGGGIAFALIVRASAEARTRAESSAALTSLRGQAQGLLLYSELSDGRLPPSSSWNEALAPVLGAPELLVRRTSPNGYGLNESLDGAKVSELEDPQRVPFTYESRRSGSNLTGGADDLDGKDARLSLGDGSAVRISGAGPGQYLWKPGKP